MTKVKIVYRGNTNEEIEDVSHVFYNYNEVGDIQIEYGKYQKEYKHLNIKDIRFLTVI